VTGERKRISREELRRIIKRHGGVDKFAALVPVESRTVWYWLAGRKMHPVFEDRVRQMGNQKER
jgi:hypothetical protein